MEAVLRMELDDLNIKSLGEVGVIPPLLKMVSGNIDSKELALSALAKLSSCRENKKLIADSGGVPLILEQMFLSHVRTIITARCSEILERLTSNDGIEFLVNSDKTPLELDKIVTNLLSFQQNKQISNTIRKPILHALLEICRSDVGLVNKAILCANGVSIILPLLDEREQEIREVAINLLFCFSKHEPHGIVDFLLVQRRLAALVDVLKDDTRSHTQMAIAGLLANLPKSETRLTEKLIELDGLQAVLNILISGTTEAKENALGVLFRFTDPTNIEFQRMVVELGFYPLLVNFVKSGTLTAKGQAAALIGNLSSNSHKLTLMISKPKPTSFWCFRSVSVPICEAHGGICSVTSTFCMLEAKALPEIISLFQEKVHATAYEGIQALSTLIYDEKPHSGAKVLHEADAISSILEVLNWGTPSLKGEALSLLAKIFVTREFAEVYGSRARIHLGTLTTSNIHEGWQLGRKAATVLTQLERYSRTSMSYRRGG
ncbi:hypothetical protein GIB67_025603 [Kingdonia uniflora]|uniref:ARM repeat superfamily protein n=1 Tax=Kingdonia uniflora TaxID=39325 RepID=A0A7J7M0Q5_9MAGN|nr:hypothetical protein GIB67_025603 [Kingdonia uniflora]